MKRRAFIRNAAGLLVAAGFPAVSRAAGFASGNRGLGGDSGFNLKPRLAAVAAAYTAYAAAFDGVNTYVSRPEDLVGLSDGKKGIFSCWVKRAGSGVFDPFFSTASGQFIVRIEDDNKVKILGGDSDFTPILSMVSTGTYTSANGWIHIYASWDLSTARAVLYVSGTNDLAGGSLLTNANIFYADGGGGMLAADADAWMFTGELCELYLNTNEYLDDPSKFAAGCKPISLGATGALPTGTAPIVYMKNPYSTWGTNSGTGGDWELDVPLTAGTPP